jgi:hypothetical protein
MKQGTIEILKALLQLVSQGQFTNDVEGARKITIIVQSAAQHIEELEAEEKAAEETLVDVCLPEETEDE